MGFPDPPHDGHPDVSWVVERLAIRAVKQITLGMYWLPSRRTYLSPPREGLNKELAAGCCH